jgi:glycolate oxidase
VEIDGNDKEAVKKTFEKIGDIAMKMGALDVFVGETLQDRERIWETRKKIGDALKAQTTIVAREDLVVPKNKIPDLVSRLKTCVKDFGGTLYAFGHLGDGNMHADVGMNINVGTRHGVSLQNIDEMRREMYKITIDLGGTITAEHGVGLSKIPFLEMALDKPQIELMKKIKSAFDPKDILNPGKMFP